MIKTNVTVIRAERGQAFDDKQFCVVTFSASVFGLLATTWEEPMFRRVVCGDSGYVYSSDRWCYLDSGAHTSEELHRAIEAHLTLEDAHD